MPEEPTETFVTLKSKIHLDLRMKRLDDRLQYSPLYTNSHSAWSALHFLRSSPNCSSLHHRLFFSQLNMIVEFMLLLLLWKNLGGKWEIVAMVSGTVMTCCIWTVSTTHVWKAVIFLACIIVQMTQNAHLLSTALCFQWKYFQESSPTQLVRQRPSFSHTKAINDQN